MITENMTIALSSAPQTLLSTNLIEFHLKKKRQKSNLIKAANIKQMEL